jgi:hypothetical protein
MVDTPGNAAADPGMAAQTAPVQEMSYDEAVSRKAELMAGQILQRRHYGPSANGRHHSRSDSQASCYRPRQHLRPNRHLAFPSRHSRKCG